MTCIINNQICWLRIQWVVLPFKWREHILTDAVYGQFTIPFSEQLFQKPMAPSGWTRAFAISNREGQESPRVLFVVKIKVLYVHKN